MKEVVLPVTDPSTARKLKLADFDLFTSHYYEGEIPVPLFSRSGARWNQDRDLIAAPLVEEALEWLRKERSIYIEPRVVDDRGKAMTWIFVINYVSGKVNILNESDLFQDRNKGLIWGLNKALDYLIKKTKDGKLSQNYQTA